MIRRTQYFSPDDENDSGTEELESPEIETGSLAIGPEPINSSTALSTGFTFNKMPLLNIKNIHFRSVDKMDKSLSTS